MSLPIQIDAHNGVPAYRQVVEQIRFLAAAGALKPGDQLPSIRELARQLGVNASTIVRAYDDLAAQGDVEQQQGRGVFLASRPVTAIDADLRRNARAFVTAARARGLSDPLIRELFEEALRDRT